MDDQDEKDTGKDVEIAQERQGEGERDDETLQSEKERRELQRSCTKDRVNLVPSPPHPSLVLLVSTSVFPL